jgi:hypothetical protein
MTLADLLINIPPISELQQLALVFSSEVNTVLVNTLATLSPTRQHQIKAIQLVDGRWLLSADILSEIGETGIFKDGFTALPQEYFPQVDVIPWDEARLLLPVSDEI